MGPGNHCVVCNNIILKINLFLSVLCSLRFLSLSCARPIIFLSQYALVSHGGLAARPLTNCVHLIGDTHLLNTVTSSLFIMKYVFFRTSNIITLWLTMYISAILNLLYYSLHHYKLQLMLCILVYLHHILVCYIIHYIILLTLATLNIVPQLFFTTICKNE